MKIDLRKFEKADRLSIFDEEVTACGTLVYNAINTNLRSTCKDSGEINTPKYITFGINWSHIQDHLIRLSAHYTEKFATDMLVGLEVIQRDLESGEIRPEGYFFGFRELGVDHGEWIQNNYNHSKPTSYYRAI